MTAAPDIESALSTEISDPVGCDHTKVAIQTNREMSAIYVYRRDRMTIVVVIVCVVIALCLGALVYLFVSNEFNRAVGAAKSICIAFLLILIIGLAVAVYVLATELRGSDRAGYSKNV